MREHRHTPAAHWLPGIALAALMLCPDTSVAREPVASEPLTPQRAIALAMDGPLELIGRFYGREIGLFDWICLFRNRNVLVSVNYCSTGKGGERQGAEVVGVRIYSARGEEVYLYAEVKPPRSIYAAQREQFIMFNTDFADLSAAATASPLTFGVAEYQRFAKAGQKLQWGSYPVCFAPSAGPAEAPGNAVECQYANEPLATQWPSAASEFRRSLPPAWYDFLKMTKGLIEKNASKKAAR